MQANDNFSIDQEKRFRALPIDRIVSMATECPTVISASSDRNVAILNVYIIFKANEKSHL